MWTILTMLNQEITQTESRLKALRAAAAALNGHTQVQRRTYVRHRKTTGWTAAARRAQAERMRKFWAKKRK